MSKHTPGPWHIFAEFYVMAQRRLVVNCGGHTNNTTDFYEENQANAHLIAAAPDLLAALEKARDQLFTVQFRDYLRAGLGTELSATRATEQLAYIDAAIAKARAGEELPDGAPS